MNPSQSAAEHAAKCWLRIKARCDGDHCPSVPMHRISQPFKGCDYLHLSRRGLDVVSHLHGMPMNRQSGAIGCDMNRTMGNLPAQGSRLLHQSLFTRLTLTITNLRLVSCLQYHGVQPADGTSSRVRPHQRCHSHEVGNPEIKGWDIGHSLSKCQPRIIWSVHLFRLAQ